MNTSNDAVVARMTTEPVGGLIVRNAVPTVVSMMVTALYNTADTYFVSRLGTSASGAVGIIFSLMAIMQAVGFMVGMGSGSIVSRSLGAGDLARANRICSSGIFLAFALGLVIAAAGTAFNSRISAHLGATPTILPYAVDYARFIMLGAPFVITSFVMNNLLRFQGKAALAMVGLTTGGFLNMALDPLFIFAFRMGISGAALATLASQCVSFAILLSMFLRKKSTAELALRHVSRNPRTYAEIVTTGLPSLFRQGMGAISAVLLNKAAGVYGDATVAALSISNRVFMFLMSVAIGLGQGFQPVCGINYGARRADRVRQAFFFLIKVTALVMAVAAVAVFACAPGILRWFRDDSAVVAVGVPAMRLQCLVLPFHALIFGTNMMFQTTGQKRSGIFLSSLRQGVYFVPAILVLPHLCGLPGVQAAQPACDLAAALTTIPFTVWFFRKMAADMGAGSEGA